MDNTSVASLGPVYAYLEHALTSVQTVFDSIPGSAIIQRYVRSSHQNDPGRTFLELVLFAFAVRTLLQSRTRADRSGKHFIQFSDKVCEVLTELHTSVMASCLRVPFLYIQEIDELVDEWIPELLVQPLTKIEEADLAAVPVVVGPNGPKPKLMSTGGKIVTNLACFNFTGLADSEHIKQRAIDTVCKYGVGTCGPTTFYGTLGTGCLPTDNTPHKR